MRNGWFPLLFLKSCHHLLDSTMFAPRCEDFQTLFLRSPLQDVDVHVANTPASHFQPAWFVQIDGISPYECPSIIVDNVFVVRRGDAKPCAERITRPIRGGTHHVAAGKISANCVMAPASFTVCVGSSADIRHAARCTNI